MKKNNINYSELFKSKCTQCETSVEADLKLVCHIPVNTIKQSKLDSLESEGMYYNNIQMNYAIFHVLSMPNACKYYETKLLRLKNNQIKKKKLALTSTETCISQTHASFYKDTCHLKFKNKIYFLQFL